MIENIRSIMRAYFLMFVKHVELEDVPIDSSFKNISFNALSKELSEQLENYEYKQHQQRFSDSIIHRIEFWKLRNINMNRSVVLIEVNQSIALEKLILHLHSIKYELGKATGYIPFLNEVGIQLIVVGNMITSTECSVKPVDTFSNQRALIQSIFIIDKRNRKYFRSITVMQTITGKVQALIDYLIINQLSEDSNSSQSLNEPPNSPYL
jgi:hypothetical protein